MALAIRAKLTYASLSSNTTPAKSAFILIDSTVLRNHLHWLFVMKRARIVLDDDQNGKKADKTKSDKNSPKTSCGFSGKDVSEGHGHRFGNFHNYYHFNPTEERMKLLSEEHGILDYIAKHWREEKQPLQPANNQDEDDGANTGSKKQKVVESNDNREQCHKRFDYIDIGCNEGDLTMEVATTLHQHLNNQHLHVMGVDLDPILIERAEKKYVKAGNKQQLAKVTTKPSISPSFQVCNLLSDGWPNEQQVDLTSIFSTTMWIHIHGGDEGLKRVLVDTCKHTKKFILIEPQPSKWYVPCCKKCKKCCYIS